MAKGIRAGKLNWAGSGAAHALRGGAFAAIPGSDIHSGMVGGFVEGVMGNRFEDWTDGDAGTFAMLAAFTSGAVSEITGGKFAVGALTGD